MRPFDTLGGSWRMCKSSVAVIREHPKLLVFPVLIAIFAVLIAIFFITPILLIPTGHSIFQAGYWSALSHKVFQVDAAAGGPEHTNFVPVWWVNGYGILIYLVSMFAATFCNVAFSSQIMAALNSEPISIRRGLLLAGQRVKSILVWSLFAGLVGVLIRQIESRLGFVGRIITGLIGLAWSVASVFAIPVIIREQPTANPIQILSHSAGTIKRTWGEVLTGFVGLRGLDMLMLLGSVVLWVGCGFLALATSKNWLLLAFGVVWLLGLFAYSYLANVASQVYLCAAYIYASEGVIPGPYDREMMDLPWKVKSAKG